MITLEGLTKRYGATRAVDALDLTVGLDPVTRKRAGQFSLGMGQRRAGERPRPGRLHELHTERASLEEAYMELTADSVQYGVAVAS